MEDLAATLAAAADLMRLSFTLYGFTFSFWDIMIWSAVAGIVIFVIWRLLQ